MVGRKNGSASDLVTDEKDTAICSVFGIPQNTWKDDMESLLASTKRPERFLEPMANARLIAAAPELLSALEDTLRLLELLNAPGTGDPIEAAVYAAKQAIAKAKGAA